MRGGIGVIAKCFVENDFRSGRTVKDGLPIKADKGEVIVFTHRFEEVQGSVLEFDVVGKAVDSVVDDGSHSLGLT